MLARTLSALCLLALLAVACGGDDGAEAPPEHPLLTDPAAVPTAPPAEEKPPFRVGHEGVSVPGEDAIATITPGPSAPATYTVAEGDTCGAIAASFGITVQALLDMNPFINDACTNLSIGEELRIPASAPGEVTPAATSADGYVVVAGDTCVSIADDHEVPLQAFMEHNGLDEDACTTLSIGQNVTIPE